MVPRQRARGRVGRAATFGASGVSAGHTAGWRAVTSLHDQTVERSPQDGVGSLRDDATHLERVARHMTALIAGARARAGILRIGCHRIGRTDRSANPAGRTDVSEHTGDWSDRYRDKWKWDKVTWGTHSVDCYPGGCPFRVYTRDGKIVSRRAVRDDAADRARHPRHEPDGLPEGGVLEPLPLLAGSRSRRRCAASASAGKASSRR